MIDCRRWLSITSWSTIPIRWLSFWRIWRYDVLQYDVVYSVMPMHFRVLYFPNFFRIYKNPVKFQLTKFFRKTKKRKMHRHGRVRNFISVLLSHWTSKTIQASNWDSRQLNFLVHNTSIIFCRSQNTETVTSLFPLTSPDVYQSNATAVH